MTTSEAVVAEKPSSITLKDGTVVNVDDHVYISSDIPSDPFYIGRVMSIVSETHFKFGWFYRPKEVLTGNRRKTFDPRLLVCSMHSDINPITSIVGKCTVLHSHFVKNVELYKNQPDCFFYDQLYDRYTHTIYDVVPLKLVKNLPETVMKSLEAYNFIVVEAGKASDFTDRRVCPVCKSWCQQDEAIRCEKCSNDFHKSCVNMPRKPPKGYIWECLSCARGANPSGEAQPNTKEITAEIQVNQDEERLGKMALDLKTFKTPWPYRYFGDYFRMSDLDDPLEIGYPRAASRIGRQYQAEVPDLPNGIADAPVIPIVKEVEKVEKINKVGRPPKKRKIERSEKTIYEMPRGLPDEIVFSGDLLEPHELQEYLDVVVGPETGKKDNANLIYASLLELHKCHYDADTAAESKPRMLASIAPVPWSEKDIKAISQGVEVHGHDLHSIMATLSRKSMPDLVQYFYMWKKTEAYQICYAKFLMRKRQRLPISPRSVAIVGSPSLLPGFFDKKAIKENGFALIAMIIGTNILLFATSVKQQDDPTKKKPKLFWEEPQSQQKKEDPPPPEPCSICFEAYPLSKIKTCRSCKTRVHAACYGPDTCGEEDNPWILCSSCNNQKEKDASLIYECILCPTRDPKLHGSLKTTTSKNWAHASCSIFIPEIKFGNVSKLEPVECTGFVEIKRWKSVCSICGIHKGATVFCEERTCQLPFHVSCGLKAGFDLHVSESRSGLSTKTFCKDHRRQAPFSYDKEPKGKMKSDLLLEYVESKKRHNRIFPTAGQKRAYSLGLTRSCSCHYPPDVPIQPSKKGEVFAAAVAKRNCSSCGTSETPVWWNNEIAANYPKVKTKPDTLIKDRFDLKWRLDPLKSYGVESNEPIWRCHACHWDQENAMKPEGVAPSCT
ncbi:putative PHD type zinc finger protein with BAH domain-containing protein [Phlyctochytrium planicorne]|nr:putative PHD type zinc finger protein with BAH domain-containing protein [Phlyctochytrium planicorne]